MQTGRDDDVKLDEGRPLRCFVGGRLVGEMPVSACAKLNGVAAGALDVGLDPSGALAAATAPRADITPLPPRRPAAAAGRRRRPRSTPRPAAPVGGAAMACWRYGDGGWRRMPYAMTLNACVQNLFAGQCVAPGAAAYGRWGDRTLRLAPGRVEILGRQPHVPPPGRTGPGCSIPGAAEAP